MAKLAKKREKFVANNQRNCHENYEHTRMANVARLKALTFHKVNNVKRIKIVQCQISGTRKGVY